MSSSLDLEWKQEPVSPQSSEDSWVSDDTVLYLTTFDDDFSKPEIEFTSCESKAEVASKLLEGLDQLENLDDWIKDEPFSNWLEEKMIPIFEDVEPAHIIPATPVKAEEPHGSLVPDTQSLLQEFETVFDAVELNHGTLTPPQSPPYEPLLVNLQPVPSPSVYTVTQKQPAFAIPKKQVLEYSSNSIPVPIEFPPATPQPDVALELAVVDELVRTRVEDMSFWNGPLSPGSSSSNFGDCSSDDPEWIPEVIEAPTSPEPPSKSCRKRPKPYTRSIPEDKKSRKKEQNKNAATRYRQKKKAEVEEILDEERGLQKINEELENKSTDIQREIKYLKGLMRDLFKAKGLIN